MERSDLVVSTSGSSVTGCVRRTCREGDEALFGRYMTGLSHSTTFVLITSVGGVSHGPRHFRPCLPTFLLRGTPLFRSFVLSARLSIIGSQLSRVVMLACGS